VATACRIYVHWWHFKGFKLIERHSDNLYGASWILRYLLDVIEVHRASESEGGMQFATSGRGPQFSAYNQV
jgi:hypothetical protein